MVETESEDERYEPPRRLAVAWFTALIVTAILVAITAVPQIREILLDPVTSSNRRQFLFLLASINVAAFSAWYFTRALLYVRYPLPGLKKEPDNPIRFASRLLFGGTSVSLVGLILAPRAAEFFLIIVVVSLLFFIYRVIAITLRSGRFREKRVLIPTLLVALALLAEVLVYNAVARFAVVALAFLGVLLICVFTYRDFGDEKAKLLTADEADLPAIWTPRVLGLLVFTPVIYVYASDGRAIAALVIAANTALFLAFVILRRSDSRSVFSIDAIRDTLIRPPGFAKQDRLPYHTYNVLLILLSGSIMLTAAVLLWRSVLPQWLGTAALMYLAAGSWISFANLVLIHPARKYNTLSLFIALPVIALGLGEIIDRNQIRVLDTDQPAQRQTIDKHLDSWIAYREKAISEFRMRDKVYPVVIVTAEGGGIRAAYWSALALASIEERYPGFHCHVFGISGASGGSLGAATYAGVVAERIAGEEPIICSDSRLRLDMSDLDERATDALKLDFLAPIAAGLLFSDLMQTVLPVNWPDRGVYLEETWEDAARNTDVGSYMEEDFSELWSAGRARVVPGLYLNATRISSGRRIVAANVDVQSGHFAEVDDVFDIVGAPLRLSTATHLSARFPILSPTGVIPGRDDEDSIVDGGYFEETGAATASEIRKVVEKHEVIQGGGAQIVVVRLQNARKTTADEYTLGQNDLLREILAPLVGLLQGHTAVARRFDSTLCDGLPSDHCIVVSLTDHVQEDEENVPFAWSLTRGSEERMHTAIETFLGGATSTGSEAQKLDRLLTQGD